MRKPSIRQRKSMEKALKRFEAGLDPAGLGYLAGRGISAATAARFRLGVACSDLTGYEKYVGRLAIPYVDRLGVYGFKFRCIAHGDCKKFECEKYLNPLGQEVGVFGVLELDDDYSNTLHVTEGEMDRIALKQHTDEPVIGLPGAMAFKPHWVNHFSGFERILAWQHGDTAGEKWAKKLRDVHRNVEVISLPPKEDVNSLIQSWGAEKVLQLASGDEED